MSYLEIKYRRDVGKFIEVFGVAIEKDLVDLTSGLLRKKPEEVMVDYEPFGSYGGPRDILVRGETSDKNSQLLSLWADGIRNVFEKHSFGGRPLKVGIKTYSVVSCWQETELK